MKRMLVMAGGTGGHVMPALAVAERLREGGVEVLWLGAADGPEARIAARAGFEFIVIHIKGLRRSGVVRVMAMPFMLVRAMAEALWVILRRRPHGALGMGGFVSGPGGLVAALLRLPLVVHEQNAVAGLTNRHLARFAGRVLSGFPAVAGMKKFTWVGNPVRREIVDIPPPEQRLGERRGPMRLLVVGGSRGARVFNRHLPELLGRRDTDGKPESESKTELEVWHQSGPVTDDNADTTDTISARYRAAGIRCRVSGFIDDMAHAYTWCDVILCRAGAMTIAEVCAAGVAAILVPYPYAVNDHQSINAAYLHSRAAALMVREEDFLRGEWLDTFAELQRNRDRVLALAQSARQLARPDAAEQVARVCREAIGA